MTPRCCLHTPAHATVAVAALMVCYVSVAPADYRVPQLLRAVGVLKYTGKHASAG